ncbi:laminin subunit alpha lam-3 [Cloeon dipterum]|uniref:laminin subunit alpha lam-3 n=1 Tax=Cloeon dipterum TaxID=197152 RepID=UPI00321FCDDA
MRNKCIFVFLAAVLLVVICGVDAQRKEGRRRGQQRHRERISVEAVQQKRLFRDDEGLFPSILNLASTAMITSNATCGENGPERFCKLAEHSTKREPQCSVCDSKARETARRHPAELAIDGTHRWWQSPTLQNGLRFQWVTITLDLGQVFEVAYVIVKAGNSPRPGNWILERSLDGKTFFPWQYYAISEEECETWFGVPPTPGRPTYRADTEVICTSHYSKLEPLEGGEIHTSIVNGRPGANESTVLLREFSRARFVRLRLQRVHTLNADLLSGSSDPGPEYGRGDTGLPPSSVETTSSQKYFYSIKDISIGGQCVCHGHATECPQNKSTGKRSCVCRHETCGEECDTCCPMFNQLPWKAGTALDAGKCEPCQCFGHADSCVYDAEVARNRLSLNTNGEHKGGGVCVDCRDHTTGINCELCVVGYYRPPGVRRDNSSPCRPCQCHHVGSPSGRCASVAEEGEEQLETPGQCECRPGYGGRLCDRCAAGFRGFPDCQPCPCSKDGSIFSEDCEEQCRCKEHVEGERCDRCQPGYFGLNAEHPGGCIPCFCSGVPGATCVEANLTVSLGELGSEAGWHVTDLERSKMIPASRIGANGPLSIAADDLPFRTENYYWIAPPLQYLADILTSYGQQLKMELSWTAARGDTSGRPTMCADLVLIGDGLTIGLDNNAYTGTNATINVVLTEEGWRHMLPPAKDRPVSRADFLRVLAGLRHVMIRAKFHTDQIEGRLNLASLERGAEGGDGQSARFIERCQCPYGYAGLSCEKCQEGFRRENNTLHMGLCLPCDCNGHSPMCDPFSGKCGSCEHHTEGDTCERCQPGYYGDARQRTPDACKKCACPLDYPESNNFSPSCDTVPGNPNEYVCTDCPPGYEGTHCEKCAPGFWGNPSQPGSTCQPCQCSELHSGGQGPSCDPLTGRCLRCRGNTVGWRCEMCAPGYFGNPESADCRPCQCNPGGSESNNCDPRTGQCKCTALITGRPCDRCEPGRGDIAAGCPFCRCHPEGSESNQCDPRTGQCPCRPGVGGKNCDSCLPNHFGLSRNGCHRCNCDPNGSNGPTCDIVSGQCSCRNNVVGRTCDQCRPGFWDLQSRNGCTACDCDPVGCDGSKCDIVTGQCTCLPGVGGRRCEKCRPGYFGFSKQGCKECEPCNKPGHICDPDTGRCVCPILSEGSACERCKKGAWGHQQGAGCKPCSCHSGGSTSAQCDHRSGMCTCRPGFGGNKCEKCLPGHYGFPRCRACDCNVAGTKKEACPFGQPCGCDETGQCNCKANAVGKHCELCKKGTFSMHDDNPEGCTHCYCYGRSGQCEQAQLVWTQIRMLSWRSVSIEYDSPQPQFRPGAPISPVNTQEICYINLAIPGVPDTNLTNTDGTSVKLNITNNLRIIPGDVGNVRIGVSYLFDTPLYWKLPSTFFGDKVLSYNGFLRFTVVSSGGQTLLPPNVLSSYPLVQIQGNNKIVLEYFSPQPSITGQYQVRFHESNWKAKHSPASGPVTREIMMLALQNIQHILIRASDSVDFQRVEIRDVSLDHATAPRDPQEPIQSWQLARGVEQCQCPDQYRASSCQNPAIGFYRWHPPGSGADSTIIIQLIGEARPCSCNSRSATCDSETGKCKNCTNNTEGVTCDRCASGYFGNPKVEPCRACPCPTPQSNRAVSCVIGRDVRCRCQKGYSGSRCERCSYGYFGFPSMPGGSCQPCNCDPRGSVSDECHEQTGHCNCRPGVGGRDCTECPRGHILGDKGCQTCEGSCTGPLLREVTTMSSRLMEIEQAGLTPVPWDRLRTIESDVTGRFRHSFERWKRIITTPLPNTEVDNLRKQSRQTTAKAKRRKDDSQNLSKDSGKLAQDAQKLLDDIHEMQSDSAAVVDDLRHYGRQSESMSVNIAVTLREAGLLLDKMSSAKIIKHRQLADETLRNATDKLNEINLLMKENISTVSMGALQDDINEFIFRINDLNKRIQETNEKYDEISKKNRYTTANADKAAQVIPKIKFSSEGERAAAKERDLFIKEAVVFLDEARENFEVLSTLIDDVRDRTQQLDARGQSHRDNAHYKTKYTAPAKDHARRLLQQAKDLSSRFNATRDFASFALKAAQAYKNIVDAIGSAWESAIEAKLAADKAKEQVHPGGTLGGQDALLVKAKSAREFSEQLSEDAQSAVKHVEGLRRKFEVQKTEFQRLNTNMQGTSTKHDVLLSDLSGVKSQVGPVVVDALTKANLMQTKIGEITKDTSRLSKNIENNLRPLLERISSGATEKMQETVKEIEQARSNVRESESLLKSLTKDATQHNARLSQWNDTISSQLQGLRDKIAQARHAANGIRLSLGSVKGRSCVRSYKTNAEPSATNKIAVTFASSKSGDGLIFVLKSDPAISKDFMALEVRDKRLRFTWDLGGGNSFVTHHLPIRHSSNLANDSSWYRAEIERTGHVVRMNVRHIISSKWGEPVQNNSQAAFTRMDAGPGALLWLGGYDGPEGSTPKGISLTHMPGCIHQVWLDGKPLGLWDFHSSSGPDSCSACIEGPEELRQEESYSFLGDGYSVLHHDSSVTYNPYQFSVLFTFKSYDEDALLFLAINPKRDRLISLSLRQGRVHFRVDYGGSARLELSTIQNYNTGEWVRVDAARHFDRNKRLERGLLRVGDEEHSGAPSPPPLSGSLLDLIEGEFIVGGAPPGFLAPSSIPPPELRSFRGCISFLQVADQGYNLLRGPYYSVEPGCLPETAKVVSFQGDGYLELDGQTLSRKSSIGLVFATTQPDALLLFSDPYSIDSGLATFYSVSLYKGQLHVKVGGGKSVTTVRSGSFFNDGKSHSVSVIKSNRRLELYIDDKSISAAKLPEGSYPEIKAPKKGGLYIGGLPEEYPHNVTGLAASLAPLDGFIKDVVIGNNLLSMQPPKSFSKAGIGRHSLPAPSPSMIMSTVSNGVRSIPDPHTAGPTHCESSRSYSVEPGAVKFGDKPNSHVTLQKLWLRNGLPKNFSIQFDFRTHYPNGLFFLFPAIRPKQNHFFMLMLKNSQLEVIFANAKKEHKIRIQKPLNDGKWHQVELLKFDQRVTMRLDGVEVERKKVQKRLNILSTAYVGGLPESNSGGIISFQQTTESYKGCMRNVRVNGKPQDLVGPRGSSHNVGQCFPRVETGSFFPGDAFAVYQNTFHVGSMFELELEFRTSELNGVLLSVSEPHGYPALSLEILDGQVILSGDVGNRKPFRVQQTFSSKYTTCDNKWHHVQAFYINDSLLLRVDQQTANYGHSVNGGLKVAHTNSSLYIGGLPDNAPFGTLQTRDNFKGCIRNMAINGERRDWTDMAALHNVLLNACPLSTY